MKPSTQSPESSSFEAIFPRPLAAAAWATVVALFLPPSASAQREPAGDPLKEASAAWLEQVGAELRAAELRFSEVESEPGTWSAPNRTQELRSRVSAAGLEVFPRETGASGAGAAWKLTLATSAFGRVDDTYASACRGLSVVDARAEVDHGILVEWFENSERGIEQGWTIARRPAGIDELEIGLDVSGELALRLDEGGRSGVFVDGAGEPRVAYRDLRAWDATGRELPARLEPAPTGVVIRLDDARAVYPITVDPLLTNPAWTAESDQAGANFGWSASTAGDVNGDGYSDVIVGAYSYDNGQPNEGRAFVYHGSASGLGSLVWTAESDRGGALFGGSVATVGDVNGDGYSDVIVGAYGYSNPQTDEGRAFVYHGSASGLATSPAWTRESNQASAQFGRSVATAGDVNGDGYSDVIVGANLYDNDENNEGRAFVYHGSASGLGSSPAWTAESDQPGGDFGNAVSTAGDVNGDGYSDVIVGATFYDNGETNEGRAFVYHGSASGLATSPAWTAESDQASAQLGRAVATAGDVNGDGYSDVIVGANLYDTLLLNQVRTDAGRAFVYHGSASGLGSSPAQTPEQYHEGGNYGISVATAGDVNGDGYSDVIVGSDQIATGRAFVYHGSAVGISTSFAWMTESGQAGAQFGRSVSTAGDVNGDGYSDVIVGANLYDNSHADEGRAYVYHGSAGTQPHLAWTDEWLGRDSWGRVSSAGDVNGDGYSDVIIGVTNTEVVPPEERALVYHGSASGFATTAAWTVQSDQAYSLFGFSVATAGDVNGDGYSDVIVGAPWYTNVEAAEGRVYVYYGSPSGLATTPAWTAESNHVGASLGQSVSTAGDVNGDGYSDVIVGADEYSNGEDREGRVLVYHGSATGLATSAAWTAESNQFYAYFGDRVSTAGDVNRDGYSDVIVGAVSYSPARIFVYLGSPAGLTANAWTAELTTGCYIGLSVASAGDVNGDGYSDIVAGWECDDLSAGAVVYHGSASGLLVWADWLDDAGGSQVSSAGDVNGDGYSDIVTVGAQTDFYLGSASGLAASPSYESSAAGYAVASAGDVNGDGYSDVITAWQGYDEHSALLFHGNGGDGGLVRALQQRLGDGTRPIALLGRTVRNYFRLRAQFPTNLARFSWATGADPSAWLEWEVKSLGVPFNGTGIASGVHRALDPAAGTLTLDEVASLPFSSLPFRWRARVATNNPLFPNTPWFSMPGNGLTEAKLRGPKPPRSRP